MKFLPHDPSKHEDLTLVAKGIFENIPSEELEDLRQAGEWAWAGDDKIIVEPEEEQPFLYIVIKGTVRVFNRHFRSGREQPIVDLYEGECFGEMSFLGGGKATAGVKAKEKTLLWRLSHENLLQYISEYKGAGQMCLNLAAILGHRLKEGNTRMSGISGGLSAYFGLSHVLEPGNVDFPITGDPAEFEIPASVMDDFARETLRMDADEVVSMQAVELVQEMLEDNKVDLTAWLDTGAAGHRMKMKIKLAEVDKDGNELEDVDYDTLSYTVDVATADLLTSGSGSSSPVSRSTEEETQPKGKPSKSKASTKSSTKAKKAATAPTKKSAPPSKTGAKKAPRKLPQLEEEEPTLLKKMMFPAACCFLAWLLAMIAILLIPAPTKAGWVTNDDGEVNGFMRSLFFPTSKLPGGLAKKKWHDPFNWDLSKYTMEGAWMIVRFETKKPLNEDLRVKVYLQGPENSQNILKGDNSNMVLKLKKGEKSWLLYESFLDPDGGTDYQIDFELMDYPDEDWTKDDARMTMKVFR